MVVLVLALAVSVGMLFMLNYYVGNAYIRT
jgi:hypothetical protein